MPIQMPFGLFTPEQLAQMAQAAFKPPQGGMQMPGMGQPQQGGQGFNVAKGIGALGDAAGGMMSAWKPNIDAEIKNWSGMEPPGGRAALDRVMAANASGGQMLNPSNPSYGDLGGAGQSFGGGGAGGPLTMQDFWSGKWLPTLGFGGGGGGDVGGFTGGGSSGWGGG